MATRAGWWAVLLAAQAAAQPVLYGVRGNGDLVSINSLSGTAILIGNSGYPCNAAAGYHFDLLHIGGADHILTGGGAQPDQIAWINPGSAAASVSPTTGRPAGYSIHAMVVGAYLGASGLHVILSAEDETTIDLLARIDLSTGAYTVIGPTGRADLEALAQNSAGTFYALGTGGGGVLYTLNAVTGEATRVGGGGFGGARALAFLPDGRLVACRETLLLVDPSTGATGVIGATGFDDIRGLAVRTPCYVNCAYGGGIPPLNALDFACFLNRFAAGDPYANCDESTTVPVLNVLDLLCFLNRFAASCSAV